MTIGLAILYGIAVMTAAFAALASLGALRLMLDESETKAKRWRHLAVSFVCGSLFLSITFWLLGA